jgi:ubiquinone/menaquinone biosynthesis C-methylase UbiE
MQRFDGEKTDQGMIDGKNSKIVSYKDNLLKAPCDLDLNNMKLSRRNFRKIAPSGFGDAYNAYPHSMTWFMDHLYVGTTRANLVARGYHRAAQHPETLGEIWPVKIPKDIYDIDLRAQIWRYDPRSDKWVKLFVSPLVKGKDGFDVPVSCGFRAMTPFQGESDTQQAIYASTFATFQSPKTRMLRSTDGVNFDFVSEPGLGLPNPPRALRAFVPFKGRLFMSPSMGSQKRWQHNVADEMIIMDSPDPANGCWRVSCEPHFGNVNNITVFHMATFKDHLYAGTFNINEGFQVWKTDAEGDPPYKWKKVLTHGAYRGKFNQGAVTLYPFKDHLYVGTGVQFGGLDIENNIGPSQIELIRVDADDSWDLVVGEPRITPEGFKAPISGKGPGFGDPFAGYLWSMCEHEGWLYAGTACWGTFLRYTSMGEHWPEWLRKMFDSKKLDKMLHNYGGCDLWRSIDGSRWAPVSLNGFDNCFNFGVRNMVSTPFGLFAGFANGFGPDVAVKRATGWNFEKNLKGGLEIWLGSRSTNSGVPSFSNKKANTALYAKADLTSGLGQFSEIDYLQEQHDTLLHNEETYMTFLSHDHNISGRKNKSERNTVTKIVDQFYGGSLFRHLGFWHEHIENATSACENLIDEVMALVPEKKGNIIDIGCGFGASTQYLVKYFPSDSITGITNDLKALSVCRQRYPDITYLYRKPPRFKLPGQAFDVVVCVKGFHSLCDRHKLLKACFKILKPGGRFVCFDVLNNHRLNKNVFKRIVVRDGAVEKPDMYQTMLHSIGFNEPEVRDITQQCREGFKRHMSEYFQVKRLLQDIDSDRLSEAEIYFKKQVKHVTHCLLISGIK